MFKVQKTGVNSQNSDVGGKGSALRHNSLLYVIRRPFPVMFLLFNSKFKIQNSKSCSQGFTLLETIIVIIIIGILAISIGYRFFSTSETSTVAGVDQAAADIQYVQTLAMGTMSPKSILFTNGSGAYNMAGEPRTFPGNAVAGTTITFTFNSLGEPTAGGDQTIAIGPKQIKVWAITGKVEELP
ncbi:MAG: prepilin-type N-terminal cleavage/methylation domain-containing protein [Proteobacteria bacterium]|nr:prepilin-type N-terminal cleavage/methylation domain-containing protein [Pseudomonadota bacterium]